MHLALHSKGNHASCFGPNVNSVPQGKARPTQPAGSRFMTDHLVLPETAANDAANAPKFLPDAGESDPMPRLDSGHATAAQEDRPEGLMDAGALADAFLSSLMGNAAKEKAGASATEGSESATPATASSDQPLENYTAKPVDVFKVIACSALQHPFENLVIRCIWPGAVSFPTQFDTTPRMRRVGLHELCPCKLQAIFEDSDSEDEDEGEEAGTNDDASFLSLSAFHWQSCLLLRHTSKAD